MNGKKIFYFLISAAFLFATQVAWAATCDCPKFGTPTSPYIKGEGCESSIAADNTCASYIDGVFSIKYYVDPAAKGYTNCDGPVTTESIYFHLNKSGSPRINLPPPYFDGLRYNQQSIPGPLPYQQGEKATYSTTTCLTEGYYDIYGGICENAYGRCDGNKINSSCGYKHVGYLYVSKEQEKAGCNAGNSCGNGKLDAGEECDPSVSGTTCCLSTCKKDTNCGGRCGDGILQLSNGEQCETGYTCTGYGSATECNFSTCKCVIPASKCGNGALDSGEECDPSISGTTCCTNQCKYDTSALCLCGNKKLDAGEDCDPSANASCSAGYDCQTCKCVQKPTVTCQASLDVVCNSGLNDGCSSGGGTGGGSNPGCGGTGTSNTYADIVIAMDRTGSMQSVDYSRVRSELKNFIDKLSKISANIRIGIVTFPYRYNDNQPTCRLSFPQAIEPTNDFNKLKNYVDQVTYVGEVKENLYWTDVNANKSPCEQSTTNLGGAIMSASSILDKGNAKKKVIVLFTDGVPTAYPDGNPGAYTNPYPYDSLWMSRPERDCNITCINTTDPCWMHYRNFASIAQNSGKAIYVVGLWANGWQNGAGYEQACYDLVKKESSETISVPNGKTYETADFNIGSTFSSASQDINNFVNDCGSSSGTGSTGTSQTCGRCTNITAQYFLKSFLKLDPASILPNATVVGNGIIWNLADLADNAKHILNFKVTADKDSITQGEICSGNCSYSYKDAATDKTQTVYFPAINIDANSCTQSSAICGNSKVESGEECERSDDSFCTNQNSSCNYATCKCERANNNKCGDGLITAGEQCDGTNWGPINSCSDFDSFSGGILKCDANCFFDTSKCTGGTTGSCGNGRIDTGEQCDGTNWGPINSCSDFDSFSGGILKCGTNCKFDTTLCTGGGVNCGDGIISPGEQCEGTNWGPIRGCNDFDNFTGGTLTCDSKCEFDTSKCTGGSSGSCGNNRIDTGEQCEGTNWGPIRGCNDFDNFTGGTLTCGNDCKFDTSACTGGGTRCGDGLITAGEQCDGTNWGPIKDCRDFDNFTGGTLTCDSNCKFNTFKCSGGTTGSCGNGRIDTGEQCEGTNWGPITGCNDFDTFSGGNLKCGVDCKFDTSACTGGGLCGNGRIDSNEECDEGSANGPWPNRCSDICKTNTITIQTADPANQSCDSLESYVNAVADITNNGGPTPIYYGFEYFRGRKVGSNFEPTTYINTTPIQSTYNNGKTRPYRITLPMESGIYCYKAFAQDDPDFTKRKFWLGAPYAKCFEVKCPVSQCSDQITIVKPRNNDQVSIINGKFDANWALTQGSGVSHVVKYRWVISGPNVYQNTETALTGATVDISKGGVGSEYTFGVYGYTADGSLCGSARSAINFIASDCCTDGTCVNIGTKDGEFDLPTGNNPALFVNSVGSRVEMKEELATLSTLEGIKWLDWAGQPLNKSNLKQFTHIRIQLPPPKLIATVPGGARDKVYEMEYSDVAQANFATQNSIANTTNFSYADLGYSPLPFFGGQAGPLFAGEKYFNVQATNQFMPASCPPDAAANEVCFIAANSSNLSEDAQLTVVRPELFTYQTFNNSYFKECKYQRASVSRDFKIDAGEWPMAVSCSATCNSDCDKSIFTVNQIKRCEAFDLNSCENEPNKDKYRYVWYCNSQGGKVDSWEHFEAMDSGNPFTQCKVVVMTKDGAFRSEGELGGNPSSEAICTAQCEACTGNICTINKASVQDINGSSCPDVQNINVSVDVGNDCQFEAMEYAVIDANTGEEVFSRKVNSKVASITASPSGSDLTYGSRQYYAVVRVKAQKGGWSANAQTQRFSTLPHKPPQAFFNIELVDNKGKVVLHGWHNGDSTYSPFTYTWNIYLRDNNNNFTEKYLSGNKQDFTIGLQRKDQKIELIVQDSEGLTCSTSTEVGPKTHPIWGGGGI